MAPSLTQIDLASLIDHTLLVATATPVHIAQWCNEADRFRFASVCVAPIHVRQAVDLLHNSSVKVSTVIGFPTGAITSAVKLYEAQEALDNGAEELDVVINLSWLKSGDTEALYKDLAAICDEGRPVKAILETPLLTDEEKRLAAEICMDAGATFVKTCTGWNGGATVEDVRLLKEVTKDRVGIKASGGIRTAEQALEMVIAGATRLGTSYSVQLLHQLDMLDATDQDQDQAE